MDKIALIKHLLEKRATEGPALRVLDGQEGGFRNYTDYIKDPKATGASAVTNLQYQQAKDGLYNKARNLWQKGGVYSDLVAAIAAAGGAAALSKKNKMRNALLALLGYGGLRYGAGKLIPLWEGKTWGRTQPHTEKIMPNVPTDLRDRLLADADAARKAVEHVADTANPGYGPRVENAPGNK